jgi:hypothetical protein
MRDFITLAEPIGTEIIDHHYFVSQPADGDVKSRTGTYIPGRPDNGYFHHPPPVQ